MEEGTHDLVQHLLQISSFSRSVRLLEQPVRELGEQFRRSNRRLSSLSVLGGSVGVDEVSAGLSERKEISVGL